LGLVRSREGCRSEAATAFRVALATYQGDYVADDPYAEWAREQRMHFSERLLNALTFLADDAWQERNLTGLVEYARQVLEVDELRERAHRHLMRAHYMLGQRACAVRH
jgi:two-component SAPR family response regulator